MYNFFVCLWLLIRLSFRVSEGLGQVCDQCKYPELYQCSASEWKRALPIVLLSFRGKESSTQCSAQLQSEGELYPMSCSASEWKRALPNVLLSFRVKESSTQCSAQLQSEKELYPLSCSSSDYRMTIRLTIKLTTRLTIKLHFHRDVLPLEKADVLFCKDPN